MSLEGIGGVLGQDTAGNAGGAQTSLEEPSVGVDKCDVPLK
jgi:hypothetical protein